MSWSVNAIGIPAAVAAKVAADLSRCKCSEPEETIKNKVAEIVSVALAAFSPTMAVQIEANGSQYSNNEHANNTLVVKITPIYGFIA